MSLDGRELREWRETMYLSQPQLASLLGIHVNSVANWENGRTRIPGYIPLALEAITGQRERMVKRLRRAQEKLAHQRKLKEIEQDLSGRKAAYKAGVAAGKAEAAKG